MKIKSCRFYQAVNFQNKMITHLAVENPKGAGIACNECRMTFIDNVGVHIETENDSILVTFNNLSCIQLFKEEAKKPAPVSKKV